MTRVIHGYRDHFDVFDFDRLGRGRAGTGSTTPGQKATTKANVCRIDVLPHDVSVTVANRVNGVR